MLIRLIKLELASFKTLRGDRIDGFLEISENFEFIVFRAKIRIIHEKVAELHIILACQISEHWDK